MNTRKLRELIDTKLFLVNIFVFLFFLLLFANTFIFLLVSLMLISSILAVIIISFIKFIVLSTLNKKGIIEKQPISPTSLEFLLNIEKKVNFLEKLSNLKRFEKLHNIFTTILWFIYNAFINNRKLHKILDTKLPELTIFFLPIFLLSLLIFTNPFVTSLFLLIFIFILLYNFVISNRKLRDFIGTKLMLAATLFASILFFSIFILLLFKSSLVLGTGSINEILFSSTWNPDNGQFGLAPIIVGTILVTGIALVIAIPISLLSAVYIAEYAPKRLRRTIRPFIDVLAGVPSVVYGLCAFLFLVPLVKDTIAPWFGVHSTGFCIFTAAITLAVMVFPIIISLCIESFDAIPIALKEASLSVGATKWETVKKVVFRASAPSVIAAILLGFGRAFGETIAVNMIVGGIPRMPSSLFSPGETLASLIASKYGELMSIPLQESALMLVALILFIVVFLFNFLGILILRRAKKRWSY
jgi:phosphate transport system permease protein